ncbi:MAG: DUF6318 family protein [Intrasporangium sp.]|uniref:DUF6318 family protein n=1 Tax=Intrasporangium sp. TaxID=1925024 RepID=UPI002649F7FF|nr:DUF6318 family protein [Intrasporangium sp.]MDN5795203.1 DUF6318 family protein [Intrasporangium sp.]
MVAKIPKEAQAETPKGAEAFVRFYFDQLNAAFREGDPGLVEGLTTQECIVCNAMLEGVKDVRAKQQRYDSDLITVKSASVMDFVSSNRRVLVQAKQNPVRVLDAKGGIVETAPKGSGSYVVSLEHEGHWRVTRLQEAK